MSSVTLADVFVGLATRWSDRTALISPSLNLSYSELIGRAARTARELRSRDIVAGTNVGIAICDGAENVVCMIAIWMLGATAVPIDFRTTSGERKSLSREFDIRAILEDRQMLDAGYRSILVDSNWTALIARHEASPVWPHRSRAAALISLTSGTTDQSVGIILDHEGALLRSICDLSLAYGDCLLNPLPLSYSASRSHTFSALLHGSSVFFPPAPFSTEELANTIMARRVTSVCAVPTILRSFLQHFRSRSAPLFFTLDALYCLGAPMRAEEKLRAKQILSKYFVEDYGTSLAGRISSLHGADLDQRPDSVGRVMPYVALEIVDSNDGALPVGEAGIIRVRAPGMARGIYGATSRASGDKLIDGWAYPGDIGVMDDTGFLRLLGRASDLIIRDSINVHPSEVELIIAAHEGVHEVVVVGFEKLHEGQEVAAFIVPSGNLSEANLVAHCRTFLSPDKRPSKFVFLKELPRNANGKVSRVRLRQQIEQSFGWREVPSRASPEEH
jgi:acyl-CoA synthetase (AMP-forming)/AMP-acid ligase II